MKQIFIMIALALIFFSPEIWRFTRIRIGRALEKHWHLDARDLAADPPENNMHLEIRIRNKYTGKWIKASAGMALLRPDEYDQWAPK